MNYWHTPTDNSYVVTIHQCSSHCNSSYFFFIIITIIITYLFLLFLYQLEEHVTYLVCEVELNKKNKKNIFQHNYYSVLLNMKVAAKRF